MFVCLVLKEKEGMPSCHVGCTWLFTWHWWFCSGGQGAWWAHWAGPWLHPWPELVSGWRASGSPAEGVWSAWLHHCAMSWGCHLHPCWGSSSGRRASHSVPGGRGWTWDNLKNVFSFLFLFCKQKNTDGLNGWICRKTTAFFASFGVCMWLVSVACFLFVGIVAIFWDERIF